MASLCAKCGKKLRFIAGIGGYLEGEAICPHCHSELAEVAKDDRNLQWVGGSWRYVERTEEEQSVEVGEQLEEVIKYLEKRPQRKRGKGRKVPKTLLIATVIFAMVNATFVDSTLVTVHYRGVGRATLFRNLLIRFGISDRIARSLDITNPTPMLVIVLLLAIALFWWYIEYIIEPVKPKGK